MCVHYMTGCFIVFFNVSVHGLFDREAGRTAGCCLPRYCRNRCLLMSDF